MKLLPVLLLLISLSAVAQQQDHTSVQRVIHDVFECFSDGNIRKMEAVVTPDVKILEQGEVWTLDSIRFYFAKPRPADFDRKNRIEFFQTEVSDKMAFVSYFNQADIRANKKERIIRWLESAVLVKVNGEWKLKMLHSTRIEN